MNQPGRSKALDCKLLVVSGWVRAWHWYRYQLRQNLKPRYIKSTSGSGQSRQVRDVRGVSVHTLRADLELTLRHFAFVHEQGSCAATSSAKSK